MSHLTKEQRDAARAIKDTLREIRHPNRVQSGAEKTASTEALYLATERLALALGFGESPLACGEFMYRAGWPESAWAMEYLESINTHEPWSRT